MRPIPDPELAKRAADAAAADRCHRQQRHDFEIHIFRHAPNNFVRAGKRSAAAENERERCDIDLG
jgi:hypothetical protein